MKVKDLNFAPRDVPHSEGEEVADAVFENGYGLRVVREKGTYRFIIQDKGKLTRHCCVDCTEAEINKALAVVELLMVN